jgi:hypothetical protein
MIFIFFKQFIIIIIVNKNTMKKIHKLIPTAYFLFSSKRVISMKPAKISFVNELEKDNSPKKH